MVVIFNILIEFEKSHLNQQKEFMRCFDRELNSCANIIERVHDLDHSAKDVRINFGIIIIDILCDVYRKI